MSWLLTQLLYSGIVFAIVGLAQWIGGRRNPGLFHGLWALVLLRLILPVDLAAPWSARSLANQVFGSRVSALEIEARPAGFDAAPAPMEFSAATTGEDATEATTGVLLGLWLLGAGAMALRQARIHRRHARSLGRVRELNDPILQAGLERWRRRFGIRRRIRLVCGSAGISPFTTGLLFPTIHIPERLLDREDGQLLDAILGHEAAHVARFDHVYLKLQALVQCIYFFHPAVWFANARMNEARERACDEMVLAHTEIPRKRYAASLVEVLREGFSRPLAEASLVNERKIMIRRIEAILSAPRPRPSRRAVGFGFVLLLGAFLLPMAAPSASERGATRGDCDCDGHEHADHHDGTTSHRQLRNPVPRGRVSSRFVERHDPFGRGEETHQGIDLAAPGGTIVVAPGAGIVDFVDTEGSSEDGIVLVLRHDRGLVTRYTHLDGIEVELDEEVHAGQRIARLGNTGKSTGNHLHFEVLEGGKAVDPALYVTAWEGH